MRKNISAIISMILFVITGCTASTNNIVGTILQEPTVKKVDSTTPILPTDIASTTDETLTITTVGCVGEDVGTIAQSIADKFENVEVQQVVDWFCDGAAFDNILVALQTQQQTDFNANDLLSLIAEGYTWEEVWDLTGLTGD